LHGERDRARRERKLREVLRMMRLEGLERHKPAQLSGGQQQRVAIARAVISRPQIILADEPTGNLDSKHGKEVMDLLKQLHAEGTTIVMVTHSQHDANYADRIVRLFDGEVVSEVEM
ncbi:MAG: ATP-binding cassette domain-containing protein, partial [Bacteroidaceae bacterium]|nr:ATP-binding cassette domain-containing protein [Bacteroidaceae bacterium]